MLTRGLSLIYLEIALGTAQLFAEDSQTDSSKPSRTNSYYVEHTHYNEFRKIPAGERVVYDVESLYFKHVNRPYSFSSNVNLSLKRDLLHFSKRTRDLDILYLHSANFKKREIFGKLDITVGRMLASRPTGNRLLDGGEFFFRDPHLSVLAWAGVDRELDDENFANYIYSTGAFLYFPRLLYFDTFVGYKFNTSKVEGIGSGHFVSAGFEWSGPLENRLYVRSVVDAEASQKHLSSWRGEMDYAMTNSSSLRLFSSFHKVEDARGRFEETLLSIFSTDHVWENSVGWTQVIGKNHQISPTYAVSFNHEPGDISRRAQTASFAYRGTFFEWLSLMSDYRYMTSHGGSYHLVHGEVSQTYNRFLSLTEKAYWATYSKITGSSNHLSYVSVGLILNALNRWNLLLEVGNSSNSRMAYDFLGRLALQYKFWK
jgi:hypothetical protein